jgi:AhpD family alkylhydroperoxidase
MGTVRPLTKQQAAPEMQETFEKLAARAGKVPNIFAAMAHRPAVLQTFLPLYKAIVNDGTVEAKYKELAYLRTSMVNGCEYCTRAHIASSKRAGITAEQVARCLFIPAAPCSTKKKRSRFILRTRSRAGPIRLATPICKPCTNIMTKGRLWN